MSSHHIIRDEQEPPVLVFQINDNWEALSEILGWSPILIINPYLRETFELKQTKIDGYVIKEGEVVEPNKHDLIYNESQLHDDLLRWIRERNCTAVNIFSDFNITIDLFNQLDGDILKIPLIFFTENGKYIMKPNSSFKKWYPEGFKMDIINDDITRTENLIKLGSGYQVAKEGFVKVEIEGDLILLKER
ncbi:hypothetical protein MATR_35920 [Marivirga tractuosa]|uniref:Thiamine pyrophosphokinase n=1 Tax=Marivirga tractuosa (strain ATCC 23168 / DSM 4126 / NBRC 15989 / NCIMB 1408 / VKM B-1430 / H-43) TaxID=643867 RepID=E4TPJ8_MARTH|nr:hypothetical protein [Marivirga tractuosa]ADR22562.1 thiamine pyrophosphokinase [Marivirga tractuosa DSM 4126]BDD16767.1 hypothetical protein MATR_35920 [Marivirga tractuosa]